MTATGSDGIYQFTPPEVLIILIPEILSEINVVYHLKHEAERVFEGGVHSKERGEALVTIIEAAVNQQFPIQLLIPAVLGGTADCDGSRH